MKLPVILHLNRDIPYTGVNVDPSAFSYHGGRRYVSKQPWAALVRVHRKQTPEEEASNHIPAVFFFVFDINTTPTDTNTKAASAFSRSFIFIAERRMLETFVPAHERVPWSERSSFEAPVNAVAIYSSGNSVRVKPWPLIRLRGVDVATTPGALGTVLLSTEWKLCVYLPGCRSH